MRRMLAPVAAILALSAASVFATSDGQAKNYAAASKASAASTGNGGHQRHRFYGVGNGGSTPRTTATGGNPGGYSNRN